MKVAVVYHFFPHYRAAVLRALLHSAEHDYLLVADDRPVDPTIKAWAVEEPSRFLRAPCRAVTASVLWQKRLLKLGLRRDLDAIIYLGNPYFLATWLSACLARLAGKRVFFWTHGWTRDEHGPKAWFRKAFYKLAHALLLYGHTAKMSGLAQGFPAENLHVIYNSLDYDLQQQVREGVSEPELADLRRQLFGEPDRPIVVCSARLTRACRFDRLLEAQARLRAEGHAVHVLLIGDGPERAALEAQAARFHLPVHFYGACYDERILARLIMAAHVTVSPGKVGLTAMQSLAYGTPVITHDDFETQGPEWEAVLPGRTGDFFHCDDVADLTRAIKKWTAEPVPSPQIRAECHRVLERFYTPEFQRRAIDRAVSGRPADDLFWMKESFA
jgi:glycosyltransferase involved in cell wall biosynthesis